MINKRNSIFLSISALVIVGLLTTQLPSLNFDYELENFFPKNDPDLTYYRDFAKSFGQDNDYLLLGFDATSSVFETDFLNEINQGLRQISALEATDHIISPTSFKSLVSTPLGNLPIPLLHLDKPEKLSSDSLKMYRHPFHREFFISRTGQTLKVILIHSRFSEKSQADRYVEEIKSTFKNFPTRLRIAGKANAQTAFVEAVQEDFGLFLVMALLIIFVMLLWLFRHLGPVIISLLVAGLSVISTVGIMAWTGKAIDVLSSLIPTILLVVAMSDIIHLYAHIQRAYEQSGQLKNAINQAVKHVGLATLLTSFTTAIGFLTLITINVKPVIDLGIYAALGIMLTLFITYLIFPTTLLLFRKSIPSPKSDIIAQSFLVRIFRNIVTNRKSILFLTVLTVVAGLIGLTRLEIDAYLVNDLPKNNQVKSDFIFFDQEFAGSKPFTLSIWLEDSSTKIYSREVITQIDKIEHSVRKHMEVGDLLSPATIVKFANQNTHGGAGSAYKLPESEREWRKALKWIQKMHPELKNKKVSDGQLAQITGYYKDLGSKDASMKQKRLINDLNQTINTNQIGFKLTGTSVLVDKSHELLSLNLIKGLLVAMGIVALIVGIMFKSYRMVFISLLPNLLPLLLIAAIMGYSGIPLSLSTSVIFAISFGIVVDDTIHFLSQFKSEINRGKTKLYAIKTAIRSSGQAILITTIILTGGFSIFCFSNFNTSFYMGLFVSLSFLSALLADLLLLPLLIILWFPQQKKSE